MCTNHNEELNIAKQCNDVRKEVGISVAELARWIGVDRKRLWYVLNGQREMRVDEFLKICIALNVDPRRFITRDIIDDVYERIYKKKP